MEVIRTVREMQVRMKEINQNYQTGFVPTMGFFHKGHLKLMTSSSADNDITVASIFVNPLQFGPNEDYEKYPRNEAQDITAAEKAGTDILFIPSAKDMYPAEMAISMIAEKRTRVLCGKSRPGHFDGVITVLTKLFNIIQPDNVYFGLKDAQQTAVVDALLKDLNFAINLVALPTVREADGLAKSSRNVNLSPKERQEAVWLSIALKRGHKLVVDGQKNPAMIEKEVMKILQQHVSGVVDYVELLSYPSLETVKIIKQPVILAAAVGFSNARIIDNIIFNGDGEIINQYSQDL